MGSTRPKLFIKEGVEKENEFVMVETVLPNITQEINSLDEFTDITVPSSPVICDNEACFSDILFLSLLPPNLIRERTMSLSTGYVSDSDVVSNVSICQRRVSTDGNSYDEDSEENESPRDSSIYGSIQSGSSKITGHTRETRETLESNPSEVIIRDLSPVRMISIPASRLRYLEYLEQNISSIIQSAVEESVGK